MIFELAVTRKEREQGFENLHMMRSVQSAVASLMSKEGQSYYQAEASRILKAVGVEEKSGKDDAKANRQKVAAMLRKQGAKVVNGSR